MVDHQRVLSFLEQEKKDRSRIRRMPVKASGNAEVRPNLQHAVQLTPPLRPESVRVTEEATLTAQGWHGQRRVKEHERRRMPTLDRNDARYAEQLNYWEARSTHMLCDNNVAEMGFEIQIPSTTMSGDADLLSLHRRIMNVLHYAVPAGERLRLHLEVAPLEDRLLARYGAELKSDNPAARLVSEATTSLLNSGRRKEILNEYRAYVTCTMRIERSRWQRKRAFGIDEMAAIGQPRVDAAGPASGGAATGWPQPHPLLPAGPLQNSLPLLQPAAARRGGSHLQAARVSPAGEGLA